MHFESTVLSNELIAKGALKVWIIVYTEALKSGDDTQLSSLIANKAVEGYLKNFPYAKEE